MREKARRGGSQFRWLEKPSRLRISMRGRQTDGVKLTIRRKKGGKQELLASGWRRGEGMKFCKAKRGTKRQALYPKGQKYIHFFWGPGLAKNEQVFLPLGIICTRVW